MKDTHDLIAELRRTIDDYSQTVGPLTYIDIFGVLEFVKMTFIHDYETQSATEVGSTVSAPGAGSLDLEQGPVN
jgi:hypothetical protein